MKVNNPQYHESVYAGLWVKRSLTEWDKILPEKTYSPEEPDETVVDFAEFLRKNDKIRVLDLACGGGRHAVYMTKRGFEITGVDISETGLKIATRRLREQEEGLTAALIRSAMNALPFVDSSFDAVICTRAVHHQRLAAIQKTLFETRRVLRRDGVILIDFLSKRTHSCGKGVEIEKQTFIETEGLEKGIIHHFTDQEELQKLFGSFRIIGIDLNETEVEGKLRSRLTVRAIK
jgi:ubiquinone/menaquinone biosynthesis C-methylase UbiE